MLSKLKTRLNHLSVSPLLLFAFLAQLVVYSLKYPNFHQLWDWPGHLYKALTVNPSSFWDTTFWGGYSLQNYPSGSHLLVWLMSLLPINSSYIPFLTVLLVGIVQIYAITKLEVKKNGIIPLILSVILLAGPQTFLGTFNSVFLTGDFPAGFGLALFILILSANSWPQKALILGAAILTHTLSGFTIGLYLIIDVIVNIKKPEVIESIKVLFFGIAIGLPWLIVFLDPFLTGAGGVNYPGNSSLLLLVPAIVFIKLIQKKTVPSNLVFMSVILVILSSVSADSALILEKFFHLRGFHFYRFQTYLLLILPLIVFCIFKLRQITVSKSVTLAILSIVVIINSIVFPDFPKLLIHDKLKGTQSPMRIIDAVSQQEAFFANTLEYQNIGNGILGSTGLFFESTRYGLPYYALQSSLNPNTFLEGAFTVTSTKQLNNPFFNTPLTSTAAMMGINYALIPHTMATDSDQLFATIEDESRTTAYYLKKLTDSSLIESIGYLPKYEPNLDLGAWWTKQEYDTRVTDQEIIIPASLNLKSPVITDISINPGSIAFKVDTNDPAPVLLKFTHNPYWQIIANGNPKLTHIYWVTPGHMLVFAQGNIKLVFSPPFILKASWAISILTFVYLLRLQKERA